MIDPSFSRHGVDMHLIFEFFFLNICIYQSLEQKVLRIMFWLYGRTVASQNSGQIYLNYPSENHIFLGLHWYELNN